MENSKTKQFLLDVKSLIAKEKMAISDQVAMHLKNFEVIELLPFNNDQPYTGELKNKIFLTYSDHYRGNGGEGMSIGQLVHPHADYEDRGYIKGVATDLEGYLVLRAASSICHYFEQNIKYIRPQFKKSKKSKEYNWTCDDIVESGIDELNQFVEEQKKVLNNALREKTGCSLLHYIQNI